MSPASPEKEETQVWQWLLLCDSHQHKTTEWRPKEAVTFASWEMEKIELGLEARWWSRVLSKPEALGSFLEPKSKMTEWMDA